MVATNLCAKNLLKYSYPSFLSATVSVDTPDLSRFPIVIVPPSTAATLYLVAVLPTNRFVKEFAPKPNLSSIFFKIPLVVSVTIPPTVVKPVALFKLNAITSSDFTFILVLVSRIVGKVAAPKSTSKAVELPNRLIVVFFRLTSPLPSEYTA